MRCTVMAALVWRRLRPRTWQRHATLMSATAARSRCSSWSRNRFRLRERMASFSTTRSPGAESGRREPERGRARPEAPDAGRPEAPWPERLEAPERGRLDAPERGRPRLDAPDAGRPPGAERLDAPELGRLEAERPLLEAAAEAGRLRGSVTSAKGSATDTTSAAEHRRLCRTIGRRCGRQCVAQAGAAAAAITVQRVSAEQRANEEFAMMTKPGVLFRRPSTVHLYYPKRAPARGICDLI